MQKAIITDFAGDDVNIEKAIIEAEGCQVIWVQSRDQEQLIPAIADADYVITQFAPVNSSVIAAMKSCKVIVRYGIGVDNVDIKTAAARNIPVCNVPDYCTDEVADHTLALILGVTRQLLPCANIIRAGQWKCPVPVGKLLALKDITIGIAGFGRIGREVAARLKAFKCEILVYDPVCNSSLIREYGCIPAAFDELLQNSDLVSLHCPSAEQTRHIINAASIARMKRGLILVNTSRGTLVNTNDLIAALKNGQISAAALDVTDPEPINPENELLRMDNVIITAHIASVSPAAVKKLRESVANTVVCAIHGERLPNVVNGVKN